MNKLSIIILLFSNQLLAKEINIYFIKGLIRGHQYSAAQTKILAEKLSQIKEHKINLYPVEVDGNGEYFQKTSATSIPDMIKQTRGEYHQHKVNSGENYMVAVSLGGMIGLNWINQHPEDFKKAVIINASLPKFCGLFDRLRPENIWTFIQALASPDPFKKEEKIFSVIINNQDKHRDLIQSWGTITRDMPVSIPNTFRQLWAAINAPVPDKPKIPVVIGVSENDRMVSSNCSKNMAKGWELPLEVNPTAGHDIINDDIDWVYQLIKENFILDDNQAKASISSTRL